VSGCVDLVSGGIRPASGPRAGPERDMVIDRWSGRPGSCIRRGLQERCGGLHSGVNLLRDPLRQQVDITIGTCVGAHEFDVLRSVRGDDWRTGEELVGRVDGACDDQYVTPAGRWIRLRRNVRASEVFARRWALLDGATSRRRVLPAAVSNSWSRQVVLPVPPVVAAPARRGPKASARQRRRSDHSVRSFTLSGSVACS